MSDHLDPLPEPTAPNMAGMVVMGLVFGAAALLVDLWITQGLLGFENPYVVFGLTVLALLAISGALRDDSLPMVLAWLSGVIVGVLSANAVLVYGFGYGSMLAGVGM